MLLILAVQAAPFARAESPAPEPTYTIVLAGGSAENMIHVWVTPDGRGYVIDSVVPLEVGGDICENPPEKSTELICKAPRVAGFEVNAGEGDDRVVVGGSIRVPVTMRGGGGDDVLIGGGGSDKLIGGPGDDRIVGRAGNDLIYGGPGNDKIFGGRGRDTLRAGPGQDALFPGRGRDNVRRPKRSH
jgi:hypothetical protein